MNEVVYIETSVVSYVVARPSRNFASLLRQQAARLWWEHRRPWCVCYISELVADEAAEGDAEMARQRLALLAGIERLPATEEAGTLAAAFIATGAMPPTSSDDAVHLAIATCAGVEFLVTYDTRHLANPHILRRLRREAALHGWTLPEVCSPEQLIA